MSKSKSKELLHVIGAKEHNLKNITLSIPRNELVVITGLSGSGKSSLLVALFRIIEPRGGKVVIDGLDVSTIGLEELRSKLGIIPQDPVLFNLSIKENLLWANSNAKESEIWNALEFVEMKTFIENLPEKLNTVVGDRGHSLSGGQRQRIAFARALIRNPEILILDEATSSVDLHTRQIIEKKIIDLSRKLTIVIISHSSSLNELCDEIFYVEDKKQISSN